MNDNLEWIITYRGTDGRPQVLELQAKDRDGVFRYLAEKQISAISIKQATSKFRKPRPQSSTPRSSMRNRMIGMATVIAICLVTSWIILSSIRRDNVIQPAKQVEHIQEVSPSPLAQPSGRSQSKPAGTKSSPTKSSRQILGKTPTGQEYVAFVAHTNEADGVVVERYQLADGSWKRFVNLVTKETRIFDNEIDSILATIASVPLTQELPPLPILGNNLEEQFKKAIEHPIIICKEDSERVKQTKAAVIALRKEMAELISDGYTVEQILAENRTLRQNNIEFRRELQQELNELCAKGDHEGAQKYYETMNVALEKRGILPLQMPGAVKSVKKAALQKH